MEDESIKNKKKNWREFCLKENILWVCGGIDSYGNVIGHTCYNDREYHGHTPEEKAQCPWRWDVRHQEFMDHFIPPPRCLKAEEIVKVQDWLVKKGLAEDSSFNWLYEREIESCC